MPMKIESNPQYDEICRHLVAGKMTQTEIAFRYDVPRTAITRLKKQLASEVAARRKAEAEEVRKERAAARAPRRPLRQIWQFFAEDGLKQLGRSYKPLQIIGPNGKPETIKVHRSVHGELAKYEWRKVILKKSADWGPAPRLKELALWADRGPDGKSWRMRDLVEYLMRDKGHEPNGSEIQLEDPFRREEDGLLAIESALAQYKADMRVYNRMGRFNRQLWRISRPRDPRMNRRRR